MGVPSADVDAI